MTTDETIEGNDSSSQRLQESTTIDDNNNMKPYTEWKHDLFQVLATALAVAAVVVPLLQWGIDSKQSSLEAKIDAMSSQNKAAFDVLANKIDEMDKRYQDHQAMYEKLVDERSKK